MDRTNVLLFSPSLGLVGPYYPPSLGGRRILVHAQPPPQPQPHYPSPNQRLCFDRPKLTKLGPFCISSLTEKARFGPFILGGFTINTPRIPQKYESHSSPIRSMGNIPRLSFNCRSLMECGVVNIVVDVRSV